MKSNLFKIFLTLSLLMVPVSLAEEVEPLRGGLFTEDLTVQPLYFGQGEKISIDEATRLALARSLDIKIAGLERRSQELEKPIADAIYDTQFGINATYTHDRSQPATVILGDRSLEGVVSVSLDKKLPTGTKVTLEGSTTRDSTNSAFALSRNYESRATLSVEQPLLKNFFGFMDRSRIKQVAIDVEKFDYETADRIEEALYEIRLSYWDLVFARENIRTRRKALRKAQDFLKIMTDQLDVGLSEKPDLFAAEANVRQRVVEVLRAENDYKTASEKLKVLLDTTYMDQLIPSDLPQSEEITFNFSQELEMAMKARRDLKQFELAIESQQIEVKVSSHERLPDLTFSGSFGGQGLDRELFNSQGEVFGFNHLRYFAGLELNTPLELREERNRHSQAKFILERLQQEYYLAKLRVKQEVDEAIRWVYFSKEHADQSSEIVRLQRKKLSEEEKNFNVGRSDSKKIIDFQSDVIDAETEAIRSLVDYRKALEALYRAKHELLQWAEVQA